MDLTKRDVRGQRGPVQSLAALLASVLWITLIGGSAMGTEGWVKDQGAHRAVVRVDRYADAVHVRVPWREARVKPAVVVDAATGKPVNQVTIESQKEYGEFVFQPATGAGDYHVYYRAAYPEVPAPDPAWVEANHLGAADIKDGAWQELPQATFVKFEAASEFDAFTPMERVATRAEIERMLSKHSDRSYLLFPEDRKLPIRMTDDLPESWAKVGPQDTFEGVAARGEYYTVQIGVYAARMALEDLDVSFEDLKPQSGAGAPIPASGMTCFNKNGSDWNGKPFTKTLYTDKEKVRPLWIGIQIPKETTAGQYDGAVTVIVKGVGPAKVNLRLHMTDQVLADAGDGEPWRYSRLRWLDSKIALDDEPTAPFPPIEYHDRTIQCLGRDLTVGPAGLPQSIRSYFAPDNQSIGKDGRELLAGPMCLELETAGGQSIPFQGADPSFKKEGGRAVTWSSQARAGDLHLQCDAKMEFDGYVEYSLAVSALRSVDVKDLRLEVPLRKEAVPYMMGLGRKGGFRPSRYEWKWDTATLQDSVWLGDVNGGLRCQLLDENYQRPLVGETFKPLAMPPSWYNGGRGGCVISEEGADRVVLRAFSGPRTISPGQVLHFNITLLLSPFKTIDMASHWKTRYYHVAANYPSIDDAVAAGVNVINLHQGNDLNPWINYPFLTMEPLKKYIDAAHAKKIKVKLYYTVRELSTRVVEMWALRSLGDEVFVQGADGGQPWMQDHLGWGYVPAWTAVLPNGELDTSLLTTALSRWHNYYLEGLRFLAKSARIDGLYLDGIGYDRTILQRARKILDRERPGSLIDWHNGNTFQPRYGLASVADLYMEAFPYIDRLWFGEMFDYGESPEFYLIEISGIPFGVPGEMINGNAYKGPVYGMTSRLGWAWGINDPRALWKLFDGFGIADSKMIGYWVPACPVRPDRPEVKLTVYQKDKKALLAMANWSDKSVECRLTIDFHALGIDPAKAVLYAPEISGYQPAATFKPNEPVSVSGLKAWLLVLEEAK